MNETQQLSLFDVYEKNARYRGDSCALYFREQEISHRELFDQTARLAGGLAQLNLPPGSRIAILCKNHPVFFHLFGAAAALNLTLVLINRRLSPDEVSYIIEDTTPCMIVCDDETQAVGQNLTRTFPFLTACHVAGQEQTDFSNFYQHTPLAEPQAFSQNDPFIIIHTAAVQGRPRGAVLSQTNIILSNLQTIQAFSLDPTAKHLNILPLFHIMGINLGLGTLQAGGTNVIMEKFDPPQALELIQNRQITLLGSFPPMLSLLLDAAASCSLDLTSLEITAGIDTPKILDQWSLLTGCVFWTMYGQTETSGFVSLGEHREMPGSAGAVAPLAHIRIADDSGKTLLPGQTGEILVRGPLVFAGYWQADDLNAHTFRQGWHHTGDLGVIDENGFLFFKARKAEKELIKPGGENVFPAEVEQALLRHEAVKDVCVFGVPDPRYGEGIKAVCCLNPGYQLTKAELIQFCGSQIAGYKKPGYVEFVDSLPRTADGAIDRIKVKTIYG